MRAMIKVLAIICVTLFSSLIAAQKTISEDVQQLVQQVQLWRQNGQVERVRLSLARLKRVAPEHLDTIAEEAFWAIHQGRLNDAEQHLFRLEHADSKHTLIPQIKTLIRLEGTDKGKLVEARLLYRGGQFSKSAVILNQLFGDNPPNIPLAILYYDALSKSDDTRDKALFGLSRLVDQYPRSDTALLGLLSVLANDNPVTESTLQQLELLAKKPNLLPEVMPIWARALSNLATSAQNKRFFEAYLAYNEQDFFVGSLYKKVKEHEAFEEIYRDHPAYLAKLKGAQLLNRGRNRQAIEQLNIAKKTFPNDTEILSNLAMAYFRSGEHEKALKLFSQLRVIDPAREAKWLSLEQIAQYWRYNQQIITAINSRQFTKAQNLLLKAERLPESPANTISLKARLLIARNQSKQALQVYKDWLYANPSDKEAGLAAAKLVYKTQGMQAFERYVANMPDTWRIEFYSEFNAIRAQYQFKQAQRAFVNNNWSLALEYWLKTIQLDTLNADYYRWAESALLQGQNIAHLPIYSAAVKRHKNWLFAHQRLLEFWSSQQNYSAIRRYKMTLSLKLRKQLSNYFDVYESNELQQQAETLVTSGNLQSARSQLRRAIVLNPSDPWLLLDYARLLAQLGDESKAIDLFQALLKKQRDDSNTVHAASLFYGQQDDYQLAIQTIDNSPPNVRAELSQVRARYLYLWFTNNMVASQTKSQRRALVTQFEEQLVQAGYETRLFTFYVEQALPTEANRILKTMNWRTIRSNFDLWTSAFNLAWQYNETAQLQDLLAVKQTHLNKTQPIEQVTRWFELQHSNASLGKALSSMGKQKRSYLNELNAFNLALVQINMQAYLSHTGVPSAQQISDLLMAYLKWSDSQPHAQNQSVSLSMLKHAAIEGRINENLVYALVERYQQEQVIPDWLFDYLVTRPPQENHHRVTWLQIIQRQGDVELARSWAKTWHHQAPDDSRIRREYVLLHSQMPIAEKVALTRDSIYQERFKLLQQYSLGLPEADVRALFTRLGNQYRQDKNNQESLGDISNTYAYDNWIVRSYQSNFEQNNRAEDNRFAMAFHYKQQAGGAGKSELTALVIPMELRRPLEEDGFWFARVDPVYLNAGTLITDQQQGSDTFGGLLLCQPQCQSMQIEQQQTGFSLALGFETEQWKADIGTTPLGFAVQDIVGGVEYNDSISEGYWSLALEKRAVDSNLLSYAGTFAPYIQKTWGGVRSTGIDLGLGYDQGELFGLWSSFGYHIFEGENTLDNQRTRAMGGVYFRLSQQDPFQFTAGLSLLTWQYAKDLGDFSFGHGGYYSPQSYISTSIPLELFGRYNDLSYKLRLSPAFSWTSDDPTDYFPTSSDYQDQASQLSPLNGVNPVYTGGDSKGFSVSYAANIEYKINKHWNIGFNLDMQRAEFYQPTNLMFYFKYYFEDNWLKVPTPPEPVIKYTEF
jgi:cellulose synthase operon protein C